MSGSAKIRTCADWRLRREVLTELTDADLIAVVGGSDPCLTEHCTQNVSACLSCGTCPTNCDVTACLAPG